MKVILASFKANTGGDVYFALLESYLKKANVDVHRIELDKHLKYLPFLPKRIIKLASSCDIIHCNTNCGHLFSRFKKPIITTAHHNVNDQLYYLAKPLYLKAYHKLITLPVEYITMKIAEKIIFPSQYSAKSYSNQHAWITQKSLIIPNGIPKTPKRQSNYDERDPYLIITVGSKSLRKGSNLWEEIMLNLPEYKLVCIGCSGNNSSNIFYTGRVTDEKLQEYYDKAGMYLSCSLLEGFGYSIAEAIANGCPVICHSNSALQEIFKKERFGVYAKNHNVNSFSEAIKKLSKDTESRVFTHKYGNNYIMQHYNIDDWGGQILRAYQSAYTKKN